MNAIETFEVHARVIAVVPKYDLAIALSLEDFWQLGITRRTKGVCLDDVREGQVYLLTVTCRLPRVLHAQIIEPNVTVMASCQE